MPHRVHLHSSLPLESAAGWIFESTASELTLRCRADSYLTTLRSADAILQEWTDPLAALQWMSEQPIQSDSRWIGYLSYDLGRRFESLPAIAIDDLQLPVFCFSLHRGESAIGASTFQLSSSSSVQSSLPRTEYLRQVMRVIDYIGAGDVFQVNLSQRFSTALTTQPSEIWNSLLETPAAYGAFLDCGDHAILSHSPELLFRVAPDRRIVTRPIKGTRPRKPGMQQQLLNSVKDQAELNMIVDLERNDLGRVCELGSVQVTQPRMIESHPTVYHGVATVEGKLRADVNFVDLLRAIFPGGSITGAPKIRAMQIIEELEPVHRGPYCGAIGYLAADGSMQFNVAIRTMIAKAGSIYIPVGGGIVADSDPQEEYDETLTKAAAMFKALGIDDSNLPS